MSSNRLPLSPPLSAPSASKLSPTSPAVAVWRSNSSGGASVPSTSGRSQHSNKRRSSINAGSRFFQFPPPNALSGSSSKGSRSGSGSGASSAARKASNTANAILDFLARSVHTGAAVVESMQNTIYCYLVLGQSPKEIQEEEQRQRRQTLSLSESQMRLKERRKMKSPVPPPFRRRRSRKSPPSDPKQHPQPYDQPANQARVKDALYDSGSVIGLVAGVGIHETKAHASSSASCLLPYASYVNGCAGSTIHFSGNRDNQQWDLLSPPTSSPSSASSSSSSSSEPSFEIGNLESPCLQESEEGVVDENDAAAAQPESGTGLAFGALCTW